MYFHWLSRWEKRMRDSLNKCAWHVDRIAAKGQRLNGSLRSTVSLLPSSTPVETKLSLSTFTNVCITNYCFLFPQQAVLCLTSTRASEKLCHISTFTFRPFSNRIHVRIWNIVPPTNLIFTKHHEFPQPNTCWRGPAHLNSIIEASHEDNLCGNEEPCIRVPTVSAGITEDGMFVYSVHN